jgi:capsular exopolysaccharide synthesis family protein
MTDHMARPEHHVPRPESGDDPVEVPSRPQAAWTAGSSLDRQVAPRRSRVSVNPPEERTPGEVREYLRVLRRRKWLVIVPTVVAVVVALVLSLMATPIYRASVQVLVQSPDQTSSAGAGANNKDLGTLSTDKTVVTSDEVVSNAIASLSEAPVNNAGQPMTAQQLAKDILVTVPSDTNVLTISYSSTDPVEAATIANALAAAYEQFKQTQADDTVTKLTEELQTQSDNIQRQIDDVTAALQRAHSEGTRTSITNNLIDLTSQQASLQAQKSQIEADNVISVTTIDPATAPHDPVSPNIPLNLLASLALGLTLGVGLAFGAEGLDDHIRDRPELQRILEAPVIGSIPAVKDWRQREEGQHLAFKDDPSSPLSEAYKALATNIMYLASQDQLQIILVTSALAEEGKTTTAANLAVSLASLEQDVVLVGMDLRAPDLAKRFDLRSRDGMSTALATPLVEVDGQTRSLLSIARVRAHMQMVGIDRLRVILGGPAVHDPTGLVSEFVAGGYADTLRKVAKFILIDTPPVLGVADASILAPLADGVVFVTDAQKATRRAVGDAREQLKAAGGQVIGAVYNNIPAHDSRYGYAYGHGRYGRYGKYGRYGRYGGAHTTPEPATADPVTSPVDGTASS